MDAQRTCAYYRRMLKRWGSVTRTRKSAAVLRSCATQNAKRLPVWREWATRATSNMDIVHMDMPGPLNITAGENYAIRLIDRFSRCTAVYLMQSRDECLDKLCSTWRIWEGHGSWSPTTREVMSAAFESYCRDAEIRQSSPHRTFRMPKHSFLGCPRPTGATR